MGQTRFYVEARVSGELRMFSVGYVLPSKQCWALYGSVGKHEYFYHPVAVRSLLTDFAAQMAKHYADHTGNPPATQEFAIEVAKVLSDMDEEIKAREAKRTPLFDRLAEAINEGLANMERSKNPPARVDSPS